MDCFDLHTRILIGGDSLGQLLAQARRVFLITDPFMLKSIDYLLDRLGPDAEHDIFSDVRPDPDIDVVTAGVDRILAFRPDMVVAFGGGSSIDAAKAIVYFAARRFQMQDVRFVAVPTTSGTGSEVSKFAVITDREKSVKYPLIDDALLPGFAALDAELTRTVPPSVTADTGMDVLTHAIEAFTCTEANDFTDAFAEKAVRLVHRYLLTAYREPDNREARQAMHHASCMAGAAFSNAGLGLCHSMAHALGGHVHIPHGRACAILLPFVMSFNAGCETTLTPTASRYACMADELGLGSSSTRQSALNLIHLVRRMEQQMKMPQSIRQAGVDAAAFEDMLGPMAEAAMQDRCIGTTPRPCSREEIMQLYRQAYHHGSRPRAAWKD